ncbi:MAG: hypothetical protein QXG18_01185 [Candidatus Pacearchaeota archaeon]
MKRKIKIEISLTNKWFYFLSFLIIFLSIGIFTYAYNQNMRVGNPQVMGHSAGEIHVNYSGNIISLQDFVTIISNQNIRVEKEIDISYDILWTGNLTSTGEITILPNKRISNYDEILFLTSDGNFGRVPVKLLIDLRNSGMTYFRGTGLRNIWKEEVFSGDDSGSVSISYVNDTSLRIGLYRRGNNQLVGIYGLNYTSK